MKNYLKYIIPAAVIILAIAGYQLFRNHNYVTVSAFSPDSEEVKQQTTFVIEFSQDLAPAKEQNRWLTDELISFSPAIKGRYKWIAANTLLFAPDFPLEPMTEYQAEITDQVLYDTEFASDFDEIEFHTPHLKAESVDLHWSPVPNQYYKATVTAKLSFNYPIDPQELKKYLEVKNDGKVIDAYAIEEATPSRHLTVRIGEMQQTEKEQKFIFTVKSGIGTPAGAGTLETSAILTASLPRLEELTIQSISSGFDGTTGYIEVATTQSLDEKSALNSWRLSPAVSVTGKVSDNILRLEGDFSQHTTIKVEMLSGLKGQFGGKLEETYTYEVPLVDVEPQVSFTHTSGKYLMYGGNKNLQLSIVNLPSVEVEVSKVYKNNLLFFLSSYGYYDYGYDNSYQPSSIYTENYGDVLYTKTLYPENKRNWIESKVINLDEALAKSGSQKGIYVLNAYSSEDRWISTAKMVAVTDLGIIAKMGGDELTVFVNSIQTTEPVGDVEITLISGKNQEIVKGKTNSNGVVRFIGIGDKLKQGLPRLITAELEKDFNFIDLYETRIETSRFDIGGTERQSGSLQAYVYAERNLFRPAETIHLNTIVRDYALKVPYGVPVTVRIISPSGSAVEEYRQVLDRTGGFQVAYTIPEYARTGDYLAEVLSGTDQLLGSYKFSVEEFAPDKIRVLLNPAATSLKPGDTYTVQADAEYLFGAKGANLRYEANIQLKEKPFVSKTFQGYNFSSTTAASPFLPGESLDGRMDENGKATINYRIPTEIQSGKVIAGYMFLSVFDVTNRPVTRLAAFDVHPADYQLGIKAATYYTGLREPVRFQIAAVNKDDKPIRGFQTEITLIRFEWKNVLKQNYSNQLSYTSEKQEVEVRKETVTLAGGSTDYTLSVDTPGEYRLMIKRPGAAYGTYTDFYAYGGTPTASSYEVDKEGRIDIHFDKEKYKPGEKARILFTAPFSGKMLITFEREGLKRFEYLELVKQSAEMTITVPEDYMPNMFVSATLFKKHAAISTTPFLVGHGYGVMQVERPEFKLPVTISAPDKITPNSTVTVKVKAGSNRDISVTLAAVDEGILQIKNFKTPDPYGAMYARRALRVESYDLYKLLLPEVISLDKSTGGDMLMAEQLQKRTNPIASRRFTIVSYFSGIRKTNANGEAVFQVTIPRFNGEVRLMAVAYTGNRFGSADKPLTVADDLVLEPEVPRFMAPNDSLVSPVTLINTTNKSGSATVTMQVTGPLMLTTTKSVTVTVPAKGTAKANFGIKAKNETGEGKITVTTSGMAVVTDEITLPVRPATPFITESGSGVIKAGEKKEIALPEGFMGSTRNATLTISSFPATRFGKQLKSLIGYPYGCIEQSISKVFPQLYLGDLAAVMAPEFFVSANPTVQVKQGIRKVESMQLSDGSIAYWQGSPYRNWWGSVYAAHFLVEAKKAGYAVNGAVLTRLLGFIGREARKGSTYEYWSYRGNAWVAQKIANKEIPYSLYVLALAGSPDLSTMNYYKARPALLSSDGVYLLAGAFAHAGKWNAYYDMMPGKFSAEVAKRTNGEDFDSDIRANAIKLNVLAELQPANPQIAEIIRYISNNVDRMVSTQDQAFFFTGVGKAATQLNATKLTVSVAVDGKSVRGFAGKDISLKNNELQGKKVTLTASGTGSSYYYWSVEGIPVNRTLPPVDNGIRVRREYYDYRTGRAITDGNFYQGQLLICSVVLSTTDRAVPNIAVADLLPAGFEIENARLTDGGGLSVKNENPFEVQSVDIRDDRLLLFGSMAQQQTKKYTVLVRVINQGTFVLPGISAEAMYDPGIRSYNGGGKIRVLPFRPGAV